MMDYVASAPEGAAASRTRDGPGGRPRTGLLFLLAAVLLAATGAAVYVTATSTHAPNPEGHAALTVVVCLSFGAAALLALRQPPYERFGVLLAAVGFTALFGALHDANDAVSYTIGVLSANLVFAVLVHAMLAFPTGHLNRRNRMLAIAAYLNVLVLQGFAILFDPLTRWHSEHPRNVVLVDSHAALSTGLEELEAAIAAAIALAVAIVLSRRARTATPAARRQLGPVLIGGKVALVFFSAGLVLAPLSSTAAVFGIGLGLLAALALPYAFIGILLQGRLSRGAVGELLVELRDPGRPSELRDALRRALGDPSLELARVRPSDGVYVDAFGAPVALPGPGDTLVATPILHQGEPVGALVHDRSLRLRPQLLDAVSAAAGFALANERALETVRLVEHRNRALLDAIPDLMIRVSRDGTYLDVHADDMSQLLRPPEELVGCNVRDVLPPELAESVLANVRRTLDTGRPTAIEYEIAIDGVPHWNESRMVPSGKGEVVTIVRDFTAERRAQAEERRLADEQAALRRVATLVASDAPPERVFQTVTEEVCRVLGLHTAVLHRFEGPWTSTIVGKYGEPTGSFEVGNLIEIEEGAALSVLSTGAPARSDYTTLRGPGAAELRALGFRSAVGVPINVSRVTWGALVVVFKEGESLPLEMEHRLTLFAELVALGVASAQARAELAASRLRIVEASDEERRRIERNLHDGAQQRLVALSVGLRLAQSKIRTAAPGEVEELLGVAAEELSEALTELRELAQGIHPAVLTERGLAEALEVLAARTPLPVALDIELSTPLPRPVEAAAYYVVSEALANVVKHAEAEAAIVRVARTDGCARVEVEDNGTGGADPGEGSGLWGLRDRVETLAGTLEIQSPPGMGTVVRAELPLR